MKSKSVTATLPRIQAHAERQIRLDPLFGADAATDFNVQAALFCQRGDGLVVGKGAVLGTVQIHDMEIFCPGLQELPRLGTGVFAVDGHPVVVALCQADDLSVP